MRTTSHTRVGGRAEVSVDFGLYKIFVHFNASMNEPILVFLARPLVIPTRLQRYLERLLRKVSPSSDPPGVCYTSIHYL